MPRISKDIVVSLLLVAPKVFIILYLVRLAEGLMPIVLFGQYMLARRYLPFAGNMLGLGTSHTLLRYLPPSLSDKQASTALKAAALLIVAIAALLFLGIYTAFGVRIESMLFPGAIEGTGAVLKWLVLLGIISPPYFLLLADLAARRKFITLNVLEIMFIGGWAVLGLHILGDRATPASLLQYTFWGCAAVTVPYTLFVLAQSMRAITVNAAWTLSAAFPRFWRYGSTRFLASLMEPASLLFGPFVLRHDPVEAGSLSVALIMARALKILFFPITLLSTVIAARHQDPEIRQERLEKASGLLLLSSLALSCIGLATIYPWVDTLMDLWLDSGVTSAGIAKYKIVALGLIPLAVFSSLKGIVEVMDEAPLNLLNLLASFAIGVIVWLALRNLTSQHLAISLAVLSIFTGNGVLVWVACRMSGRIILPTGGLRVSVAAVLCLGINYSASEFLTNGHIYIGMVVAWITSGLIVVSIMLLGKPPQLISELRALFLSMPKRN